MLHILQASAKWCRIAKKGKEQKEGTSPVKVLFKPWLRYIWDNLWEHNDLHQEFQTQPATWLS